LQFIRARSNLILSCFSGGYSLFRGKGGEAGYKRKRKSGENSLVVIIFSRLINRSIFDNRKKGFLYFIYVVVIYVEYVFDWDLYEGFYIEIH